MKNVFHSVLAAVYTTILIGCASAPTTSGYLSDYDRLQPGERLEKYWADTSRIQESESITVLLGEISADMISDQKEVTVVDCVSWLTAGMEEGGFASRDAQNASIRVDLAITFMSPGSAAGRMWAGELGAGHAQVQVEGKVFDTASGDLLATFAERRRSSGSIGLKDIGGDAAPGLIEQMITLISDDIRNQLLHTFTAAEVSDT